MHGAGGGPSHPPIPIEWAFSDEVGAMNFYNAIQRFEFFINPSQEKPRG